MKKIANTQGFTLIEIVFSLIILGVLGTLVAQHYFDLREEAERKLAKATVDAVQVKINSRFTRYMAQGYKCENAVEKVDTLPEISDDRDYRFGEFELSIASGVGDVITSEGVPITATSLSSKRKFQGIALLEVPKCVEISFPEIDVDEDKPSIPDKPIDPEFSDNELWDAMEAKQTPFHPTPGLFFVKDGKLYVWVSSHGWPQNSDLGDNVNKDKAVLIENLKTEIRNDGELWVQVKNGWARAFTYVKNSEGQWEVALLDKVPVVTKK